MIRRLRSRSDHSRFAHLLEDERFIRGLGVGALIGAAIAGSTIWSRHRETRPAEDPHAGMPSREGPGVTR